MVRNSIDSAFRYTFFIICPPLLAWYCLKGGHIWLVDIGKNGSLTLSPYVFFNIIFKLSWADLCVAGVSSCLALYCDEELKSERFKILGSALFLIGFCIGLAIIDAILVICCEKYSLYWTLSIIGVQMCALVVAIGVMKFE